uniref:MFS domain-containing protein n=1 Tax=Macrostomum lignano TaxID=282301 RepID=A0A1I8GFY3_9PLAT
MSSHCLQRCCKKENTVGVDSSGNHIENSEEKDGSDGSKVQPELRPLLARYWPLLVLSWCMELSLGAAISMPGPTLPYLALKVSEPIERLGFMFTGSSLTSCLAAWLTGLALARLTDSSRVKLIGLLLGNGLLVAALIATPSADSLAGLIAAQCTMGAGVAVISTVDNMLVIYLFGPILSRSLSHFLHFCVGLGGFLAPLLARPFLISMGDVDGGDVCGGSSSGICSSRNGTRFQVFDEMEIAPQPTDTDDGTTETISTGAKISNRRKWTIVTLFVLFYVLHAGQESGFWSYLYSFGVCSRLCLSPDQASLLSTIFFVGYLVSRGSGVLVSRLVQPSVLLIAQLTGCLFATSLLASWGDAQAAVAYTGAGLYGLCIAMVFPTGITWLAERLDVTGALSSTWSVGTYIGASTYPLATGYLIGADSVG